MIKYREITIKDNQPLGNVMEKVLLEFNATKGASMLGDPTLYKMFEEYQEERSVYFIALIDNVIVGGCGIKKIPNQEDDSYSELQRMYLSKKARGKRIGKTLIEMCFAKAKEFEFSNIYIESFPQMKDAINLYAKNGFHYIDYAIGNTGHDACDVKMLKKLN